MKTVIKTLGLNARPCKFLRARDGDTVEVLIALDWGVWLECPVRLVGLDSWELNSPDRACAQLAAERLTHRFKNKDAIITPTTRSLDKYGRIRARLTIDGLDFAAETVKMGLGWVSDKKNNGSNTLQCPPTGDLERSG